MIAALLPALAYFGLLGTLLLALSLLVLATWPKAEWWLLDVLARRIRARELRRKARAMRLAKRGPR
jgi:hypothetical protein